MERRLLAGQEERGGKIVQSYLSDIKKHSAVELIQGLSSKIFGII
jgi:hypothetical protein